MSPLDTRIKDLPKAELHVHLRGAMPAGLFCQLLNKYNGSRSWQRSLERYRQKFEAYDSIRPYLSPRYWTEAEMEPLFRFSDFEQFLPG